MNQTTEKRRPRLLVVLPSPAIGGAETCAFDLLRGIRHFDCALLTQAAIADYYRPLGTRLYRFDDYGGLDPCSLSRANIRRYARAIRAVVADDRTDAILALMHHGTMFAVAARRLFSLQLPVIGSILGNISAYFASVGRSPSAHEQFVVRYGVLRSDAVIVPSHGVRDDLIEHHGALPERVKVIHNGVDADRCRTLARAFQPGLVKDGSWIVSASRLCRQKDFDTLLDAFRIVLRSTPATLVLLGDGELRSQIQDTARRLNIADRVILTGFQHNPFPYIARADVFVLSSFFEGFGNVIAEAMAVGVPVVASDCPSGPSEIIQHGESGLLVAVGDAQGMAEAFLHLIGDCAYRKRISAHGLARAGHFGVERMTAAFDQTLMSTLAAHSGTAP